MVNSNGPIPQKTCINGHLMTEGNVIQRYTTDGTKNGRKCKTCSSESARSRNLTMKIEYRLKKEYGLNSFAERDALLESQGGKCAICGTSDCVWGKGGFKNVWHIDHRHDGTPNHRGIICATCNNTIGRANDDPALLRKMADYIESFE